MKFTRTTLGLFLLTLTIVMAAFLLLTLTGPATAERIGLQSAPPPVGDWVINTKDNYIIDETIMYREIPPEEGETDPSYQTYDDSVEVKGNLIIQEGGELTLLNASLSFNDESGDGFYIEVHGSLIMTASGEFWVGSDGSILVSNNSRLRVVTGLAPEFQPSAPLLDHMVVTGSLAMDSGSSCKVEHFKPETSYIQVENAQQFDGWNLPSCRYNITDSSANISHFAAASSSDDADMRLVHIRDSVVNFQHFVSSSNGTIAVWLEDSEVVFNDSMFLADISSSAYKNNFTKGIYALDSTLSITNSSFKGYQDYAVRTRGTTECYISDCVFKRMNENAEPDSTPLFDFQGAYNEMKDCQFSYKNTGLIVGGSDEAVVRLENVFFYNVTGDVVHYDGSGSLEMEDCTIAHVVGSVVVVTKAQEFLLRNNNFSYTREWDSKEGDYVVKNIKGKAVVLEGVENVEISENLFRMTDDTPLKFLGIHNGNIKGNNFHKLGYEATDTLHAVFLDRSHVSITDNEFNGSSLQGGYEIFAVGYGGEDEDTALDWNTIKANNQFHQSVPKSFAQAWELRVRTLDVNANPLNQVPVTIDNGLDPAKELWSDHLGRIGPYYILDYSITGQDNLTDYDSYSVTANLVRDNISFSSGNSLVPNSHQELVIILNTLSMGKKLDISEPDSGKVLTNFKATLTYHVNNHGNGVIYQNFLVFYRMSGEDQWLLLDEFRQLVEKGDKDYSYIWSDSLEPGDYDFKVSFTENVTADPSTAVVSKNRVLTVFARPSFGFDTQNDVVISGKAFTINGWAIDPQDDSISEVELAIDRGEENGSVKSTLTKMSGYWHWEYTLDTTSFPNREYTIWTRARNSVSFDEFAYSDWESLTFKVLNTPTITLTGTIPNLSQTGQTIMDDSKGSSVLITGLIRELYNNTHIMERVDVMVDGTLIRPGTMKINLYPTDSSWSFTWDDYQEFADGPHDFEIVAYYDNGEELVALPSLYKIITINSNRAETDPVVVMNTGTITEEGNYNFTGTASDDWQLSGLEYRLGSNGQWNELAVVVEGTQELSWDFQLDYTQLLVGANYIYVRASDDFTKTDNFTILSFNYRYDLEILEISIPRGEQPAKENFSVSVTVRNNGPHRTPDNVMVQFYVGSIQREMFVSLDPGQTEEYEFTFNLVDGGNHTARAVVNPGMLDMETHSDNNEMNASRPIVISSTETSSGEDDNEDDKTLFESTAFVVTVALAGILLLFALAFVYQSVKGQGPSSHPEYKRLMQEDDEDEDESDEDQEEDEDQYEEEEDELD